MSYTIKFIETHTHKLYIIRNCTNIVSMCLQATDAEPLN